MFATGLTGAAFGSAGAVVGGSQRLAPGGGSTGSSGPHPLLPTHPAGAALWVGVGSVIGLVLLWHSLPR